MATASSLGFRAAAHRGSRPATRASRFARPPRPSPAPPRRRAEGPRTAAAADGAPDATPPDGAFALGCPHFEQCPGCTMAEHLDEPPTLARARAFFEARGVPSFAARTGATRGWRTRAKLAVRSVPSKAHGAHGKADPLALGLFARGTHDLVEIPGCVVHHPRINQAARYVADVANAAGVRAYDEKTGDGHLRYAQFTAVASKERGAAHLDEDATVQVALVWNGRPPVEGASMPAALRRFIDALVDGENETDISNVAGDPDEKKKPRKLLHGVWVNFNDSSTNTIVSAGSNKWHHAHGPKYVWCSHGDARVCYAPGSFLQANTEAYNALLASMRRDVPRGSAVSELYAGAGAIGLSLVSASEKRNENEGYSTSTSSLRSVEIVEANRETFEMSALETFGTSPEGSSRLGNVSFCVAAAADAAAEAVLDADVLIVDPPRKGLDARTLAALAGHDVEARDGDGTHCDDGNEPPGKPLDLSLDPRRGKQGAAGSGRKKRNKRNRRAKKRLASEGALFDAKFVPDTPPPPDRLRTLIYVSCGFISFERDCDALIKSGQWKLKRAEGFNFFPGSDALETLAVFQRVVE